MSDNLGCSAGCKRTVPDMKAASDAGWELLPISQRWRCPDCTRELEAASRGEWPKETQLDGSVNDVHPEDLSNRCTNCKRLILSKYTIGLDGDWCTCCP